MLLSVEARAWLNLDDEEGNFRYEDAACRVEVQRTDENEVRIGIQLRGEYEDEGTVYLTVSEAGRLAHMLGMAVLANEAAAHEAASL